MRPEGCPTPFGLKAKPEHLPCPSIGSSGLVWAPCTFWDTEEGPQRQGHPLTEL